MIPCQQANKQSDYLLLSRASPVAFFYTDLVSAFLHILI